jgi:hypothetical protein
MCLPVYKVTIGGPPTVKDIDRVAKKEPRIRTYIQKKKTDRQTDRQRDRQTDKETDRQTKRKTDKETFFLPGRMDTMIAGGLALNAEKRATTKSGAKSHR